MLAFCLLFIAVNFSSVTSKEVRPSQCSLLEGRRNVWLNTQLVNQFNRYGLMKFCCSCTKDAIWWFWPLLNRKYKTIKAEGKTRDKAFASLKDQIPEILNKAIKEGPREFACLYRKRRLGRKKYHMICFFKPVKLPENSRAE